jgi:hypothetical protein
VIREELRSRSNSNREEYRTRSAKSPGLEAVCSDIGYDNGGGYGCDS